MYETIRKHQPPPGIMCGKCIKHEECEGVERLFETFGNRTGGARLVPPF